MTDTSIALVCNLTEPELRNRKEILRGKLSPFLTQASYAQGTSQLVFSKVNVSKKLLEELISLERECCPFFGFDLSENSSHFHLSVTGPVGSETMVRDFFSMDIDKPCGCTVSNQPFAHKKKHAFGFITLCAVGCAVPPTLTSPGFIGAATGAYFGMWVEGAVILAIMVGGGYLFVKYMKKRQRRVSL